jgi:hypothetical protein
MALAYWPCWWSLAPPAGEAFFPRRGALCLRTENIAVWDYYSSGNRPTAFAQCDNHLHSRQSPVMPHYRIYVTTTDGHITAPATLIECDNDQEAIGKAKQFVNGRDVELWEGARFIVRFPASS